MCLGKNELADRSLAAEKSKEQLLSTRQHRQLHEAGHCASVDEHRAQGIENRGGFGFIHLRRGSGDSDVGQTKDERSATEVAN